MKETVSVPGVEEIRAIYGEPDDEIKRYQGLELDPFQQDALYALQDGKSVLVSAPTGAGKTLIAEYAIEKCIEARSEIIYTAPIKALSNQKFRNFSSRYGDRVGIMTGDVTIHPDASALIMTTEVFRNTIFENPERLRDVQYCIFDEIHYMDDRDRGTVWEESIIYAPQHIRFISLSATISNLDDLAEWMNEVRDVKTEVIHREKRPVPLRVRPFVPREGFADMEELERLFHSRRRKQERDLSNQERSRWEGELLDALEQKNRMPTLYFVFSRAGCRAKARRNKHRDLLSPAESRRARDMFEDAIEDFGLTYSRDLNLLRELVPKGIAYHHAGLLPSLKEILERLFTEGLIQLVFATETFALGINMPARSVVFESLQKFDGEKISYIKTREFQQMAGRAGRRGIDSEGFVYPVIDWPDFNLSAVKRIIHGDIEPIKSKFGLSYSTILNLYRVLGEEVLDACKKSFIRYQSRSDSTSRTLQDYEDMVEQMDRRLTFLKEFNYIDNQELTAKGDFASRVNGYEVQVAEYLFSELMADCNEIELLLLLSATVFEERGRDQYPDFRNSTMQSMMDQARHLVNAVVNREEELGIYDLTKKPDFGMAALVYDWARGVPFRQISRDTDAAEGDLVRTLRMTIQLCRQTYQNMEDEHHDVMLTRRLMKCAERINRGVVDAEKQLSTKF